MEDRNISALRKFDNQSVGAPFGFVISLQPAAQFSRLHPDDGVKPRVEGVAAAEKCCAEKRFLQTSWFAVNGLFNGVGKEPAEAVSMNKLFAGKDLLQVSVNRTRRNLQWRILTVAAQISKTSFLAENKDAFTVNEP